MNLLKHRRLLLILLTGLLMVTGLSVWFQTHRSDARESYVTASVGHGDLKETVSALGTLQPYKDVDVGAQVSGQLTKIHVDVGDKVKEGDLLAEIDPTLYRATAAAHHATLKRLRAQLAEKRAGLALAGQQLSRNRDLIQYNAVSQDELQQSETTYKIAEAQIQAPECPDPAGPVHPGKERGEPELHQDLCPLSGTVVSLVARQGQTLNARQQTPVILRIADLDTMTVWTQVTEADVVNIRQGMKVYFNTLGEPDRRWHGEVRQILPTPEIINNVVLYSVLFDVGNPDQRLKTQMSAQVFFVLAQVKEAILVPAPQKNEKFNELERRFQLLEERLRENENTRKALIAEMEHFKEDLAKLKTSDKFSHNTASGTVSPTAAKTGTPSGRSDESAKAEMPIPGEEKASKAQSGINAGCDGGFYIRSADGSFQFRPIGILHVDFRGHEDERQINTDDTLASTFDIRRLRLGFEGHMWKDIGYTFEVNIDDSEAELIYAYLNFGQIPWAQLRVGQFKEPFSYEVLYPEKYLDFVERSNVGSFVAPAEDIGVMVHNLRKPYAGMFEYGVGIFNGEGINDLNDAENDDMEVAGRVAVLPFVHGPA